MNMDSIDKNCKNNFPNKCEEVAKALQKASIAYEKNSVKFKEENNAMGKKLMDALNCFSVMDDEDSLVSMNLLFKKLDGVSKNIVVVKLLLPMMKELKKVTTHKVIFQEGNIQSWKIIDSKIERFIHWA